MPIMQEEVDDLDEGQVELEQVEGEEVEIPVEEDDKGKNKEVEANANQNKGQEERLGAGREQNQDENQKRAENRRIKAERKARREAAIRRDKTELNFLRARLEQLENQVTETRVQGAHSQAAAIDGRIGTLEGQLAHADTVLAQAIEANNGADVVKITQIRDKIRSHIDALKGQKQQVVQSSEQIRRQPAPQADQPNPAMVAQALAFKERHEWLDLNGGDEDSAVVMAVEHALSKDSRFDPTTTSYWNELEKRVKKYLPHRFEAVQDDDEDDDDEQPNNRQLNGGRQQQPQRRGGPRMPAGAGNGGNGGNKFFLSAERKQAMVDHGVWDDPGLRARYIKKYQEWDAKNASQNRR